MADTQIDIIPGHRMSTSFERYPMLEVSDPTSVQVQKSEDGSTLWIHVDGQTVLRASRIEQLEEVE